MLVTYRLYKSYNNKVFFFICMDKVTVWSIPNDLRGEPKEKIGFTPGFVDSYAEALHLQYGPLVKPNGESFKITTQELEYFLSDLPKVSNNLYGVLGSMLLSATLLQWSGHSIDTFQGSRLWSITFIDDDVVSRLEHFEEGEQFVGLTDLVNNDFGYLVKLNKGGVCRMTSGYHIYSVNLMPSEKLVQQVMNNAKSYIDSQKY